MIQKIVLSLAFLTVGMSSAHAAVPAFAAPVWSCAINADIDSTSSFPFDILALARTWEGQGVATCVTPEGTFSRVIALKITKYGAAIGLDRVMQMHFLAPEVGVTNWNQLFTSYEFGPSVDATTILIHGEVGVGVTLKSSGGLTVNGALGAGPAVGLRLGVSVLGTAQITDLGEAAGLF